MPTKVLKKSLTLAAINLDQPVIKKDYHGSTSVPGPRRPQSVGANRPKTRPKVDVPSKVGKTEDLDKLPETLRIRSVLSETTEHHQRDRPQVGEGNGTYEYDNRFFKYEGQWKNGKKHGQGKLTFTDGSFYEGQFKNGEIEGFGSRYYARTGCKYQGQFVKGEMQGKGRMTWPDGSIYEGSWLSNQREGFGIIKSVTENSIYKGMYVKNKRQGQGMMIYPQGDTYDGDWQNDLRHGEGDMKFVDGTVYEGFFENDSFNGQGQMRHCSGVVYDGQWIEGKPIVLPHKLVIVNNTGTEPVEITQGEPFSISVKCVTEQGELVEVDSGRQLHITAGFKHIKAKKGTALFDLIEEYEEKPMQTPYYEVLQYPLTDFIPEEEAVEEEEMKEEAVQEVDEEKAKSDDEVTPAGGDSDVKTDENQAAEDKVPEETTGATADAAQALASNPEGTNPVPADGAGSEAVKQLDRRGSTMSVTEMATPATPSVIETILLEKESCPLPPPVANKRSEGGICEWTNIQLAQAPPRFPPFVALDEEDKKLKARQNRQVEAKRLNRQALDERYARIGEYVIMVQDVTNPPFMGQTLESAYITVKMKKKPRKPKKPKEVKPKWDTSKHIEGSMVRS